jgi:hypothetical protein
MLLLPRHGANRLPVAHPMDDRLSYGAVAFHIEDGLITEQHGYWDLATWFRQLGILIEQ